MKIIEFCGVSGCGKSTLINAYIKNLEESNFHIKKLCCKFYRNGIGSKIKRKVLFFILKILPLNIRLNRALKRIVKEQEGINTDWVFQILLMNWRINRIKNCDFLFLDEGIVQSLGALYFDAPIKDETLVLRVYRALSSKYRENVNIVYCRQDYDVAVEQLRKRNRVGDRYLKNDDSEIKKLYAIQEDNLKYLVKCFTDDVCLEVEKQDIDFNIDFLNSKLNG